MEMASTTVVGTSEGGTVIPPSQRPDGTWRKPRRVKAGYVPQDEVPLYESRGKQWAKSRTTYPVGLDPELIKASEAKQTAKTNVGASKKKKKGVTSAQPVPNPGAFDDYDTSQQQQPSVKSTTPSSSGGGKKQESSSSTIVQSKKVTSSVVKKSIESTVTSGQSLNNMSAIEPAKRLRNLKKKLKDIENLEQKIITKELKNPDKDQIEKISRKADVQAEILALDLEVKMNIKTQNS